MKKKAFTLIELIAVLVILAILALIVTPLVMNIIRKARIAADKRSIDAYGRSIELAIANYLLDNGDFPTSINDLTIEYSGDEVLCSTTQLNIDSSVYLTGCTVAGRTVDYAYGSDKNPPAPTYTAYTVGDSVTYNNVNYYVIADSDASESTVTLLKAEPLSVAEVNQYGGVGTANNHVNMYVTSNTSESYYQTAYDQNGYGGMAYYSSATCGNGTYNGCTTSYASSEIKYVVDAWKDAKAPAASEARLITRQEIENSFEFEEYDIECGGCGEKGNRIKSSWMYNDNYWYCTSSPYDDSSPDVWFVRSDGGLDHYGLDVGNYTYVVRPVIVINKNALD